MKPACLDSSRLASFITKIFKIIRIDAILLIFSFLAVPLVFCGPVLAGSGLLTTVGGVTFVQGATQFWVTSQRPTFSGVTTAGVTVSGTVGSQTLSATADSSGNWSWTPSADLAGDNTVSITSGSTTAAFTLTIGQLPANIASASAETLAPAGNINPTLVILGVGLALVCFGSYKLRRSFSKS